MLAYGPNSIDINGDGRPDLVLKAWRESFNGSGFQTYQFLVNMGPERRTFLDERQRERDSAAPARGGDLWEVVPIEDPDGKRMQLVLAEAETGPCNLRTAALVHQPGVGIVLIVAEKRATADILGSSAVAIDFYTVAHNPDGVPGEPTYSFRRSESVATKKSYCDAREALDAILAGRD
ncbi:MAG: FG-GAP repeat protein [Alphaproteobacteria bacterium]|nr:FG-GAP repeat protein [Alphaproteobacteria bacterium]